MKIYKPLLIRLMLVMLIVAAAGYSAVAAAQDKNTVLIQDYQFQPAEVTIQKGETITWTNQDNVRHTATGNSFDSGLLSKGQSFQQTFNEAGTYDYICTPHPKMMGKIIVQ
jgi:amicyanin